MTKYKITIEFESDIEPSLAEEIAVDAFVQLETIEDEDYGKVTNSKYKIEQV